MRTTYFRSLLAVAAVATLAACSGSSGGSGYGGGGGGSTQGNQAPASANAQDNGMGYGSGSSTGAKGGAAAAASGDALMTAGTSLGTIVVDGKGMTAYVYDKDTKGTKQSACTGVCQPLWPAIESSSTTPTVKGVTGTVATITGVDGKPQVTLNGWPLYTFTGDAKAGDTNGQGYQNLWSVIFPDGTPKGD